MSLPAPYQIPVITFDPETKAYRVGLCTTDSVTFETRICMWNLQNSVTTASEILRLVAVLLEYQVSGEPDFADWMRERHGEEDQVLMGGEALWLWKFRSHMQASAEGYG